MVKRYVSLISGKIKSSITKDINNLMTVTRENNLTGTKVEMQIGLYYLEKKVDKLLIIFIRSY